MPEPTEKPDSGSEPVLDPAEEAEVLGQAPANALGEDPLAVSTPAASGHRPKLTMFIVVLCMAALCAAFVSIAVVARVQDNKARALSRQIELLQRNVSGLQPKPAQEPADARKEPAAGAAEEGQFLEWMDLGCQLFRQGRYEDAKPYFEAAAKVEAGPAAAYFLAQCCHRTKDASKAVRLLHGIRESYPNSPYAIRATCLLARNALEAGRHEAAQKMFYEVLAQEGRLAPEDQDLVADALYGIGDAFMAAHAKATRQESTPTPSAVASKQEGSK